MNMKDTVCFNWETKKINLKVECCVEWIMVGKTTQSVWSVSTPLLWLRKCLVSSATWPQRGERPHLSVVVCELYRLYWWQSHSNQTLFWSLPTVCSSDTSPYLFLLILCAIVLCLGNLGYEWRYTEGTLIFKGVTLQSPKLRKHLIARAGKLFHE